MLPKQHLIYGTLFVILFYVIFPHTSLLSLFVLWISTWFLIDLDHPIYFTIKHKSLNPIRFWKYSKKRIATFNTFSKRQKAEYKSDIMILHGIETFVIITLLGTINSVFYFVIFGFVFHLILDSIDYYKRKINVLTKLSVIYTLITNKKKSKFIVE